MSPHAFHELLFLSGQYAALASSPAAAAAGPPAYLRILSLLELERFDEAVAAATAAVNKQGHDAELIAALALAKQLAGHPLEDLEDLNVEAERRGGRLAWLNLAYLAIVHEDFAEAQARLKALDGKLDGDRIFGGYRRFFDLQAAAYKRDTDRYMKLESELEAWTYAAPSVHNLAWLSIYQTRGRLMIGEREAARDAHNRAKSAVSPLVMPRLHRQVAITSAWLTNENSTLKLCTPGHRADAYKPNDLHNPTSIGRRLERKPVLGLLFRTLVKHDVVGATKEELVYGVWNLRYDPLRHDERLLKSLARLRHELEAAAITVPGVPRLVVLGDRWLLEV